MESLKQALSKLFGLSDISLVKLDAGFLSDNYEVTAGAQKFFLKGYRYESVEKIAEIHKVKNIFAGKGIPVIMPIATKTGETFFSVNGKNFALFPFVSGIHYNRGVIPPNAIKVVADLLAKMHRIGKECGFATKEVMSEKDTATVMLEARHLLEIIVNIKNKSAFDKLALASVEMKLRLMEEYNNSKRDRPTEPPILIHGDFHDQNVFFGEDGEIKYVFDFEKAMMAPRWFELWQSADYMFINGDFSKKRVGDAITYLKEYNLKNSISEKELLAGLDAYYRRLIHGFWAEKEHYLKGNTRTDRFLENKSTRYLSENMEKFKRVISEGVYDRNSF